MHGPQISRPAKAGLWFLSVDNPALGSAQPPLEDGQSRYAPNPCRATFIRPFRSWFHYLTPPRLLAPSTTGSVLIRDLRCLSVSGLLDRTEARPRLNADCCSLAP